MDNKTGKFQARCGPEVEDVICRMGQKCFQHTHYLRRTTTGDRIPADACPFQALVSNLYITSLTRAGGCARITGTYDVRVWFTYNNGHVVAEAKQDAVPFRVHIPLADVAGGCQELVCEGGIRLETQLCATNLKLEVLEVALEAEEDHTVRQGGGSRLKVIVEKEFQVFEHGLQRLCVARCLLRLCPPAVPRPAEEKRQPSADPTGCPEPCTRDEVQKADAGDLCLPSGEKPGESTESPKTGRDVPTAPGAIKGRLVDENGNGLFRARIIASDGKQQFRTRTNYKGIFLLPLYPDTYKLTAMKRGYIAQTLEIAVGSGEIKALELTLYPDPARRGFRLKLS